MKEDGMNKLIELLDEYDSVQYHKINHKIENGEIYRNVGGTDGWHQVWRYSKSFGFIKWLVDNDKIDLKEFHRLCGIINQDSEYWNGTPQDYEQVIMYLSISDYPIEDLVSILK